MEKLGKITKKEGGEGRGAGRRTEEHEGKQPKGGKKSGKGKEEWRKMALMICGNEINYQFSFVCFCCGFLFVFHVFVSFVSFFYIFFLLYVVPAVLFLV